VFVIAVRGLGVCEGSYAGKPPIGSRRAQPALPCQADRTRNRHRQAAHGRRHGPRTRALAARHIRSTATGGQMSAAGMRQGCSGWALLMDDVHDWLSQSTNVARTGLAAVEPGAKFGVVISALASSRWMQRTLPSRYARCTGIQLPSECAARSWRYSYTPIKNTRMSVSAAAARCLSTGS
jgi:hypothetical protein